MAAKVEKRGAYTDKESEINDEDKKLQETLLQLVDDLVSGTSVNAALRGLRKLMRTSTTSMTAVPKPLKYLKDSYGRLKRAHRTMADDTTEAGLARARLADIVSVLALAAAEPGERECLDYCLRGSLSNPGAWGHEYVQRLAMELVDEWSTMPLDREREITEKLLPLAKKLVRFDAQHNAEIQACDLALEIDRLDLLVESLDKNNYSRVCLYLASTADYAEDLERREILRTVVDQYMRFNEPTKAILTAMRLPDHDLVNGCFDACQEPLLRKQLAYALARLKDHALIKPYKGSDADELERILGNGHVNAYFQQLIRELDILEPKSPDEIYGSLYEPSYGRVLIYDSARANLAASFASAFVHAGFGRDKLMTTGGESAAELNWVYKNKEHAMMSATASLGLLYLWDCDGGLVPIDKFLYASDDLVKSGALLAIGLVNCGVRSEYDPAMALLGEHVMSTNQNLRVGSILGLGLAYAATKRPDLNGLLYGPLNDRQSTMEVIALSAVSLGLINVGSADSEVSSAILQRLLELDSQQLASTYSRFLPLALGMLYMGRRDGIEAVSAALEVLAEPYRLPAQTMLQVCSYANTGDVLVVQELLRICSEPVEVDKADAKTPASSHMFFGDPKPKSSTGRRHGKKKEAVVEMVLTQPIAALGVAVVDLSEGKENSRILGQIGRYGSGPARTAVPLSFGLTYLSNPDPGILDVLNKYSHDADPSVSLNAIFAIGLVGAGTNNARFAVTLRQLAAYYANQPSHLFVVRIAQGLVHMGKGTITLQPLKYSYKILDQASLAGLLVVLVSFLDCNNLILGKNHYLMYCLALAMEPRWLVTLDEDLKMSYLRNGSVVCTIHDTLSQ
uniref:26S proteasome non-ATPase regulatory subunit 2 n=1 Tax=Trichogramma kaykai TaxID=54128 RepID=A0ABD2XIV7_9HYME